MRRVRDLSCGDTRIFLEIEVRRVECRRCGAVKQERLDWLADNPFYTKRFAFYVGRRCRAASHPRRRRGAAPGLAHRQGAGQAVHARATAARRHARARVIGIDEISIRKGHTYRIVVSDLVRRRPIWFGGKDRSEESMDEFFAWLGAKKAGKFAWR